MTKEQTYQEASNIAIYGLNSKNVCYISVQRLSCPVSYSMTFQNTMLKRIFEPRRDALTGECGRFHNNEINRLDFPANTTAIKSGRTRLDVT